MDIAGSAEPTPHSDESAPTTTRTSSRTSRIEVITRAEPRRSWTAEQKRAIVDESFAPDLKPTGVARKYGISTGQLYTWRQQLLGVQPAMVQRGIAQFAEVELRAELPISEPAAPTPLAPSSPSRPKGLIELVLPNGMTLRLDAHVDGQALRRILAVLDGR